MATEITWTDDLGPATLANGIPEPGDRFSGWTTLTTEKGARVSAVALGTGITSAWNHRTDYGAKFSLNFIEITFQQTAARLKEHLEGGGVVTVTTGDNSNNTFDCTIWPGSEVTISAPDKTDFRFSVALSVRNTASAHMICIYN